MTISAGVLEIPLVFQIFDFDQGIGDSPQRTKKSTLHSLPVYFSATSNSLEEADIRKGPISLRASSSRQVMRPCSYRSGLGLDNSINEENRRIGLVNLQTDNKKQEMMSKIKKVQNLSAAKKGETRPSHKHCPRPHSH